jgi:hypothetical protein
LFDSIGQSNLINKQNAMQKRFNAKVKYNQTERLASMSPAESSALLEQSIFLS